MALTVGELNATINLDNKGFNSKLDESEGKFRGFGSRLTGFASSVTPAAAMLGLTFGAVTAGVGAFMAKAISAADVTERTKNAFAALFGSKDKAAAFYTQLAAFAETTPFELQNLQAYAQQLAATGLAAGQIVPDLKAAGDMVSALGGDPEKMQVLVDNLSRVQAQGHVTGRELMELGNAGIPIRQILGAALKMTPAQLEAAVSSGKISADMFTTAFQKGTEGRFGGLMSQQMNTITGIMSNLQDAFFQDASKLGTAFINGFGLKDKLKAIGPIMDAFTNGLLKGGLSGGAKGLLEQFISADAVEPAIDAISDALNGLGNAFKQIGSTIGGMMSGPVGAILGPGGLNLWDNLDGIIVVVAAAVGGVLAAAFAALAVSAIAAALPLVAIGLVIGLVALGAFELYKHWGSVMEALKPFTSVVGPALHNLIAKLQPAFANVRAELAPLAKQFGEAFKEWSPILHTLWDVELKGLATEFTWVANFLGVVLPPVINIAMGYLKAFSKIFDSIAALLRGDWKRALGDWKSAFMDVFNSLPKVHIPMPHFSLHGNFNPADWATGHNLPGLDVNWYDKGGIFSGPQVIGVGEKRPEVVAALDDLMPLMVRAMKEAQGGGGLHAPITINGNVNPRKLARELALEFS